MDLIIKYIKDPSWWFTAFFIAIIASLIAGFLKDRIEKVISHLSKNYRIKKEKQNKDLEVLIESLVEDTTLFAIAYLRAVTGLIVFSLFALLFLTTPLLSELTFSGSILSVDKKLLFSKFLIPFIGGMSIGTGFRATRRLNLIRKAMRRLRDKNNLPQFP